MMNRWKPTINSAAASGQPLSVEKNSDQRGGDLDGGAVDVCHEVGQARRPQVVREVAVVRLAARNFGANIVLLTIGGITLAKCLPNFEKPAPTHTTTITIFNAMIMLTNGKSGEDHQHRQVLLAAGGQEDGLVPQSDQHQQRDRRDQQRRVHQTGCVVRQCLRQRVAVHTRCQQRHGQAHQQRRGRARRPTRCVGRRR